MKAKSTLGEPCLLLDAAALQTNLRTLRRVMPATVKFCAVLKANAYGHGAEQIAQHLLDIESVAPFLKVDAFATATLDEAGALAGLGKPMMVLRPVENAFLGRQRELIEAAIHGGWSLTIASAGAADDIARIALHLGQRANVQIMIDTGMTRCGVSTANFASVLERTLHHASLKLAGVATHLVSSEVAGDSFTTEQLRAFNRTLDEFPILESIPRHAANSGAIFLAPRAHFDLVRAGIALYGIDPTGRPSLERSLAPVARWTAPIIAMHDIEPGRSVGYGQSWVAPTRTRVATLSVGYADGYPRCAGNRAVVMVHGQPCGVVGRVSMDMTTIDVTAVPDATIGDEVTLLDPNPLSPASVYQLARIGDTIPYEVMTRVGPRVRRVGINSPVASQTADADAGESTEH
jgi:alanine racemase